MERRWLSGVAGLAAALVLAPLVLSGSGGSTPVNAAVAQAPALSAPPNGTTLTDFNPSLQWTLPPGSVQYQVQVAPSDGPAINVIRNAEPGYAVPAPPDWYGLLPDQTYTWRVRASDATTSIGENDPSWGPWSENRTFRTPQVSSSVLALLEPAGGASIAGFFPTLYWKTNDPSLWYFEVQVSRDVTFTTDPAAATAMVYWELRHGGATDTTYSYTIPSSFPLEPGTTYYWRVRPRVQGDGTPVGWTPPASFKAPSASSLFLQVASPANESTVNAASITVAGMTKAGAIVTVNADLAAVDVQGNFSAAVSLVEGINSLDIIASDSDGNILTSTLSVTFIP